MRGTQPPAGDDAENRGWALARIFRSNRVEDRSREAGKIDLGAAKRPVRFGAVEQEHTPAMSDEGRHGTWRRSPAQRLATAPRVISGRSCRSRDTAF